MPERNQKKQKLIALLSKHRPQAIAPPAAAPPSRSIKPNKPHRISVRGQNNIVVFGDYVTTHLPAKPADPEPPAPAAAPPLAEPAQTSQALIGQALSVPQDPRLTLDTQKKGDEPLKSESSPVIRPTEVCNIERKYRYSVTLLLQKCVKFDLIQKITKYLMISIAYVTFFGPNYSLLLCDTDRYPTRMPRHQH